MNYNYIYSLGKEQEKIVSDRYIISQYSNWSELVLRDKWAECITTKTISKLAKKKNTISIIK